MADEAGYFCPACGGLGKVTHGREVEDGEIENEGVSDCWACNRSGRVGEEQVFRHRIIVLARKLAERAVALRQETPLMQTMFALEGKQHNMGIETFTEVQVMETQGHFESEFLKLRPDLVETLFDLLTIPKPDRWDKPTADDIPF